MRYVSLKVVYHNERVAFRRHQRGDAEWTFTVINKLLDVWTPSVVRVGWAPPWCGTAAQNWTQHLDVWLHNKTTRWGGWGGRGGPVVPVKHFTRRAYTVGPMLLIKKGPFSVTEDLSRYQKVGAGRKTKSKTHMDSIENVLETVASRECVWGGGAHTASQQ